MDRLDYIERLKDALHSTDYIAIKNSEGIDCSEYGNWKAEREAIREEIRTVRTMADDEFEHYEISEELTDSVQSSYYKSFNASSLI